MASEVDICNLALSNLGDTATVASINPPDGSAQAEHCARFYPFARNALLEMATWGFATKRFQLAQLENTSIQWQYAYAMPTGVVSLISVIHADLSGDDTPQPYTIEVNSTGQQVILTNVENALLRYSFVATDPTTFSPLFTLSLSYLLASMLAGPLIKGETGAVESKRMLSLFEVFKNQATVSDANDSRMVIQQATPWVAGR